MRLPFFNRKKENSEADILLALDIGTEFVKAVLFQFDTQDKKILVKGYGRSKQNSNAMQGAMIINLENVINTCDHAIGNALAHADQVENDRRKKDFKEKTDKDSGKPDRKDKKSGNPEGYEPYQTPLPNKVIIGIAGELVKGITIMADYERENSNAKIDDKEINEVVQHIKKQAFTDAVSDIAEEIGLPADSLIEINTKINSTYIDGVKVDDPLGFTGKEVAYRIFSTFAPRIHVNSLKEIARHLSLEVLSIEVEPYAITRAVKSGRKKDYSAILLDIGGGTTDVALVDKGAIAGTKMFAFGGRVFTKRLAVDFKLELNEAERTKLEYASGKMGHTREDEIRKSLNKDISTWTEAVELALAEIEDIREYPGVIYICGGGSALPEMREGLLQHPWLQVLPFLKYPKVEYLYPSQLEDILDTTRTVVDPADIAPLALARMYLELEH